MEPFANEILSKYAKYAKIDNKPETLYLGSAEYELYQSGEKIKMLLGGFDRTGYLSVLYAEKVFTEAMKGKKYNALDVFTNKADVSDDKEMYETFQTASAIKANYLSTIQEAYARIGGDSPASDVTMELMLDKLQLVIEQLGKLSVDCWKKAGPVKKITKICRTICVFETMAECILTLENAEPAIYLCFIRAGGTADCYFEIMFNDGAGNLYGFHDRINEKYLGQHHNLRNGRWTEDKSEIFPYDYCFTYSGHDYKGYATKYEFDESYRELRNLDLGALLPLIMVMLHAQSKYEGEVIDEPIHYSSLLIKGLSEDTAKIAADRNEIMNVGSSGIILSTAEVKIGMTAGEITDPETAKEFNRVAGEPWEKSIKRIRENEVGNFDNINYDLVKQYSDGFEPIGATDVFMPTMKLLKDADANDGNIVSEMIGTEKRLRKEVFFQNRKKLAAHIQSKLTEEVEKYGGTSKILETYTEKMRQREKELKEECLKLLIQKEKVTGSMLGGGSISDEEKWNYLNEHVRVEVCETKDDVNVNNLPHYLNAEFKETRWKSWRQPCEKKTGHRCSIFVKLRAKDAEGLAYLSGTSLDEMPAFMKMKGGGYGGNSLLDSIDYVAEIQNILKKEKINFWICFCFTKNGLKKEIKEFARTAQAVETNGEN